MVAVRNLKRRRNIMSTTEKTETVASKQPSHIAYVVRDREGQKAIFTRIGAAWPTKDGKGFNVQLDALPTDGRITLLVPSEKKD
jgi:hypothetical protein